MVLLGQKSRNVSITAATFYFLWKIVLQDKIKLFCKQRQPNKYSYLSDTWSTVSSNTEFILTSAMHELYSGLLIHNHSSPTSVL